MTKQYLTPKAIWRETGITQRQLQHARKRKYLTDVKETVGGRLYYFTIEEVCKVFPTAKQPDNIANYVTKG